MWFALFTGPFILAAAITITQVARKAAESRGKVVSGWVWAMTFFGSIVILIPVAYGVLKLWHHSQAVRQYQTIARTIDYQTYWPTELPEDFEVTQVTAQDNSPYPGSVSITYATPVGNVTAYQARNRGNYPGPEDCKDYDPDHDPEGRWVGKGTKADPHRFIPSSQSRCRVLVTPEGNEVVISMPQSPCDAALEIEATRLSLDCRALDDDSIARYFDSMEPIDPMDIEFSDPRIIDLL